MSIIKQLSLCQSERVKPENFCVLLYYSSIAFRVDFFNYFSMFSQRKSSEQIHLFSLLSAEKTFFVSLLTYLNKFLSKRSLLNISQQEYICFGLFANTNQTIHYYNTKSPFLMNNVITTPDNNHGKISLRTSSKIISPLKPKQNTLNQVAQEPLNSKQPHMTRSFIIKSDNREPTIGVTSAQKPKILLKKGQNCKCDSKHQHFQEKERMYYVSLVSQAQKSKRSRKFLHISIDLDKIRSQEKKQTLSTLVTDQTEIDLHNRDQTKVSTLIPDKKNTETPIRKISLKENLQSEEKIILKSIMKEKNSNSSRKRHSSKQIRQNIMKKKSIPESTIRTKSLDNIIRADQQPLTNRNNENSQKSSSFQTPRTPHPPLSEEQTLKALFKKLTKNNLPYQNWINYLNMNCKQLTIEELHFVGILLEKIQPKYLSAMSYLAFKYKITQTCQKELQELVRYQQLNQ